MATQLCEIFNRYRTEINIPKFPVNFEKVTIIMIICAGLMLLIFVVLQLELDKIEHKTTKQLELLS